MNNTLLMIQTQNTISNAGLSAETFQGDFVG